jgi:PST family polysaccharide transporter
MIGSLGSVQSALFVRDLAFRQLFWIKLETALVPGFFSIPLAFFGYGVWALVAGSLTGSLLNLALMWAKSAWRPRMQFDWYLAQELFGFGIWVVLESLGIWFYVWVDNLLVGKLIGIEKLGIYSIAWNINSILFSVALNSFFPVLHPTFSRLQGDIQTLKETFHKANMITISLGLPMGIALLLINQQFVSVFFGNRWQGLGFVLGVMGFMFGISCLVAVNPELYRAMGRPDVNSKLLLSTILYSLPVYLVTAPYGLEVFTLVRLGVDVILVLIHVYLCTRMLGISPFYLWFEGKSIILATLAMAIVLVGCKEVFTLSANALSDVSILISLIIAGGVTYGGTLWLLDQPLVLEMKALFRRVALT